MKTLAVTILMATIIAVKGTGTSKRFLNSNKIRNQEEENLGVDKRE